MMSVSEIKSFRDPEARVDHLSNCHLYEPLELASLIHISNKNSHQKDISMIIGESELRPRGNSALKMNQQKPAK